MHIYQKLLYLLYNNKNNNNQLKPINNRKVIDHIRIHPISNIDIKMLIGHYIN